MCFAQYHYQRFTDILAWESYTPVLAQIMKNYSPEWIRARAFVPYVKSVRGRAVKPSANKPTDKYLHRADAVNNVATNELDN